MIKKKDGECFKDTFLYWSLSVLLSAWWKRCWYLKIITMPIIIIQLLIAVIVGIIFDFVYFVFLDDEREKP